MDFKISNFLIRRTVHPFLQIVNKLDGLKAE